MMKKLSRRTIGFIILGTVLTGMVVFAALGKKKPDPVNFDVTLQPKEGAIYESKLDAFKDKNKEEQQRTATKGRGLFGNSGKTVNPTSEVTTPLPDLPQQNVALLGQSSQQAREIAHTIRSHAPVDVSDNEYDQVRTDIQQVYQKGDKSQQSVAQRPVESDKERRRRELLQSWGEVSDAEGVQSTARPATDGFKGVVHGTQTVSSGKAIAFRSSQDMAAPTGEIIPKNTLITGVVSLSQTRLMVSVGSVRVGRNIIPVQLSVYGTDGMPGIPVVVDNVAKATNSEVNDEAISQVGTAARRYGGTIGGAVGDVITGAARSVKREKEREVTLLDNQMIIFKFN